MDERQKSKQLMDEWQKSRRAKRVEEAEKLNEDYSTAKFKSNIDKKWFSSKDIVKDIQTYIDYIYGANGGRAAMEAINAIKKGINNAEQLQKHNG